jgi:hypothetical protein
MIIMGAMPAQHLSGVSHYRRRSQQAEHDFAGAVGLQVRDRLFYSPADFVDGGVELFSQSRSSRCGGFLMGMIMPRPR